MGTKKATNFRRRESVSSCRTQRAGEGGHRATKPDGVIHGCIFNPVDQRFTKVEDQLENFKQEVGRRFEDVETG